MLKKEQGVEHLLLQRYACSALHLNRKKSHSISCKFDSRRRLFYFPSSYILMLTNSERIMRFSTHLLTLDSFWHLNSKNSACLKSKCGETPLFLRGSYFLGSTNYTPGGKDFPLSPCPPSPCFQHPAHSMINAEV